ncbi:MAG: hypothetical protein ACI9O6_002418 [Glaciecola sp.]|jgi:hypothetical protein|tara:strand:+ start:1939 stop:2136 length:198 start_codon:yes stop_codon:yes gene_type:complete
MEQLSALQSKRAGVVAISRLANYSTGYDFCKNHDLPTLGAVVLISFLGYIKSSYLILSFAQFNVE